MASVIINPCKINLKQRSRASFMIGRATLGARIHACEHVTSRNDFHQFFRSDLASGFATTIKQAMYTDLVVAKWCDTVNADNRLQSHKKS